MKTLGLTGGIGMGKSTTALLFRRLGIPLFDADLMVHHLSAPGGAALPAIARAFPEMIESGRLDRAGLARLVFWDHAALQRLEAILHPLLVAERARFLRRARRQRRSLVVLDIPLLFESGGDSAVDRVVVVSCPAFLQRRRALARPGMSSERLARVRALQMPDAEKKKRADWVIPTGAGKRRVLRQILEIRRTMQEK
jgi:dephospho-CoA kinase